jgi:hypothetical protein
VPPVVVRIRKGPKQSNQSLARSVVTISHLARALDGKLDNKNDRAPSVSVHTLHGMGGRCLESSRKAN